LGEGKSLKRTVSRLMLSLLLASVLYDVMLVNSFEQSIPFHVIDRYRYLVSPPNIAVTNLSISRLIVLPGDIVSINVTVQNQGSVFETFNVTVYADEEIVGKTSVWLNSASSVIIPFTWNTAGLARGSYTIIANASIVEGETDTSDNARYATVYVGIPGDINDDGTVDVFDAVLLSKAAGSTPDKPNWNPNADLNNDGIVDIFDAVILAAHAGEHI
jgi:hypothetical protein